MMMMLVAMVIMVGEGVEGGRVAGGRSLEFPSIFDPRRLFTGRLGAAVLQPHPPPPPKPDPRKRKGKRTHFIPPKKQALYKVAGGSKDPGFFLKAPGPNISPPQLAELRSAPLVAAGIDPAAEFVAGSFILTQRALDEAPYRYSSFLTKVNLLPYKVKSPFSLLS